MATDKLITMKQFNGTDYDTLYPKTIASQVDGVYNKQEVIEDATKSMFGYGSSAIPDTIFQFLGQYNLHWWSRKLVTYAEHRGEAVTKEFVHDASSTKRTLTYSDTVTLSKEGVTLNDPKTIRISYSTKSTFTTLIGKYVTNLYSDNTGVYFVGDACTVDGTSYGGGYYGANASDLYQVTSVVANVTNEYVKSSDRNAYPDSGESGGYEYLYLGVPFDNAVNGAKIETGSYVGTGTYGSANPCSLTFGFSPSVLIISGVLKSKSTSVSGIGSVIMNISYGHYGESYAEYSISGIVEKTENQVRWYSDNAASEQMNTLSSNYYYIALG